MQIALCGFYGKRNFGDDLMADRLPVVLGSDSHHTVTLYSDCDRENIQNGDQTKKHLDADVIVIGGGGIVAPNFWALKDKSIFECNKPIAFVNVNVTVDLLKQTDFIDKLRLLNARWWVRDNSSHDILKQVGIESTVIPDISFMPGTVPIREAAKGRRRLLVFGNAYLFNQLFDRGNVDRYLRAQHSIHTLAHFLDWMAYYGWRTVLLPSQTGAEIDDRIINGVLYGLLKRKNNVTWVAEQPGWRELTDMIASSDLVISMRFHASTCALASGTPLIDITHHAKNRQLLAETGMQQIEVPYDEISQKLLVEAAQASSTVNKEALSAYLLNASEQWTLFTESWNAWLSSLMDSDDEEKN